MPSVTGKRLLIKKLDQVTPSTLAKIPRGIKVILATLCSKPHSTNRKIGKNIARIFPATFFDANAIHTATQTRTLQKIPLIKALVKLNDTFELAMLVKAFATFSAEKTPA